MQEANIEFLSGDRRFSSSQGILETCMANLTIPIDGKEYSLGERIRSTQYGKEWFDNYQRMLRGRGTDVFDITAKASDVPFKPVVYFSRGQEIGLIKSLSPGAAYVDIEAFTVGPEGKDELSAFSKVINPNGKIGIYDLHQKNHKMVRRFLLGILDESNIRHRWGVHGILDLIEGNKVPDMPLEFIRDVEIFNYRDEPESLSPSTIRFKLAP